MTDNILNSGNIFTNNAITFEILLQIQCCHNKCPNSKKKSENFCKTTFFRNNYASKKIDLIRLILLSYQQLLQTF